MHKVLNKLNPLTKSVFERVYEKHMSAMGVDERAKYEGKVKSVKTNAKEGALKVTYANGDWWYYSVNGSWY